jgi:peptide/nickel transport system ATP-binding protein
VLFISHNLGVIAKMCDRVGVLYAGAMVEEGSAREVFEDPRHPYTVGLLRCIPRRGQRKDHGRLDTIPGFLPSPGAVLPGCVFVDRCAIARERCRTDPPPGVRHRRRAARAAATTTRRRRRCRGRRPPTSRCRR